MLESEKIQLDMSWLEQPRLCSVWVHRTVRWCTGQCPVRQAGSSEKAALGNSSWHTVKIHRTVRCAPDCPVSQRSAAQSARDAWPGQRSEGGTGQRPVRQRLQIFNGQLRQNRKEIRTGQCPVVHRTVRCASRQKARIVFLECSQRLLDALGL
jgi:hypothetical protein